MSSQIYCTNCGTGNDPSAGFCRNCGQKLIPTYEETPQQPSYSQQSSQPSYTATGSQPMGQYLAMKKGAGGPGFVSICCFPGAGLLMVDPNEYFIKFLISVLLSPILIGYILGIVWTFAAVEDYNRELAYRLGVQPY